MVSFTKKSLVVLAFIVGFAFCMAVQAKQCQEPRPVQIVKGMKVIASLAGPNWAEATVKSVDGQTFTVSYSDGGLGSLSRNEILPHPSVLYAGGQYPCFRVGEKVIARDSWPTWRMAKIVSINTNFVQVAFPGKGLAKVKPSEILRKR